MATTLSYSGTLMRSNVFDSYILRKFAGSSGDANKEFSATIDLVNDPLPTLPLTICTQGIETISFLFIQAIGGSVKLALNKGTDSLEITLGSGTLKTGDTLLMSGIDLTGLTLTEVTKSCILEIYGMGY